MDRFPQSGGTPQAPAGQAEGCPSSADPFAASGRFGSAGQGAIVMRLARILAVVVAGVVGVGASAGRADAQTAEMTMAPMAQDRGLRTGEFVLYPSMGLMGHYDSNLFNGSDKEKGNLPVGATSLRFLPRLSLVNDPNSNVTFSFLGAGDARLYMSDNANVKAQQNVGGNVNLDVTFGQRRALSFSLFNYFNRALRANNWETSQSLNRIANDVGARIEFHPGDIPERRPFNVAVAAAYAIDLFDDFSAGNTSTIRTKLTGSWRFLPKTAAILDTSWDFRKYERTGAGSNALITSKLAADSKPFRVRMGLSGALTKRVSLQALAGWGISAHAENSEFNSYLASVGVGLRASESTRFYVAYDRDFSDSFFANFASFHRFSLSLKQRFGSVLDVSGSFGVRLTTFGMLKELSNVSIAGVKVCTDSITGATGGCRQDTGLDGNLTASFELHRLVGMNVGYTLRKVATNFKIQTTGSNPVILDVGEYTAHEIFATLVARY